MPKIALTCVLGVLLTAPSWAQDQTRCVQDAAIGKLEQLVDSAAMNFADALIRGDSDAAFSYFSVELRKKLSGAELTEKINAIHQWEAKSPSVEHTYLIQMGRQSINRVVCGTGLSRVTLSAADVPEQAHILLSADTRNNRLAMTVWVFPENAEWKVRGFWFNVAALADQGPSQLWDMAREQTRRDHLLNAALLYTAALQFMNRGPDFEMETAAELWEVMTHITAPPEIQGPAPFSWRTGDKSWQVLSLGPIAVGGKIYVIISHLVPQFQTETQVDGWNKELLAYFKKRFPEYSDVFAGVVIRAYEKGTTRGFGTVEELPAPK